MDLTLLCYSGTTHSGRDRRGIGFNPIGGLIYFFKLFFKTAETHPESMPMHNELYEYMKIYFTSTIVSLQLLKFVGCGKA